MVLVGPLGLRPTDGEIFDFLAVTIRTHVAATVSKVDAPEFAGDLRRRDDAGAVRAVRGRSRRDGPDRLGAVHVRPQPRTSPGRHRRSPDAAGAGQRRSHRPRGLRPRLRGRPPELDDGLDRRRRPSTRNRRCRCVPVGRHRFPGRAEHARRLFHRASVSVGPRGRHHPQQGVLRGAEHVLRPHARGRGLQLLPRRVRARRGARLRRGGAQRAPRQSVLHGQRDERRGGDPGPDHRTG